MKHKAEMSLLLSTLFFLGSCLIVYKNPRLDWISILWLFLLASGLGLLHCLLLKRKEDEISAAVLKLSTLLESIENREEEMILEDDLFGVLRDEIYKSLVSQRHAREEAVKAKAQLKRNMEDVTHQIKTPLTGILLLLDLLETDPENAKEYQARIRQEVERLHGLSDLLLKLSSLDAGAVVMQRESFSTTGLLIDVELSLDFLLQARGLSLAVEGEDFAILGDRVWLMEALINLVKNAIEVSPEKSVITIVLEHNAIYQSITVVDEGPGLKPEQAARVFERFYKSDPRSMGFGIGLSMVRSIVEQHGGEVSLKSSDKGCAFEIRLYPEIS
ncbi:MAG TPA: HAMP domain-containing sensor histidine kinase [Bacillota bacterium]|jgi:signal transduction histidine kinase|nr:HAMP domain-containing sensor histidine kinase [Bacillota bacterium]HOI36211.1 HAMP domain-containing sensor histidine kinase [Bacillota bacterium]